MKSLFTGCCLVFLGLFGFCPERVGAAVPAEIEELLGLCAQGASLPEGELPATVARIDQLIGTLDSENMPRNKVWLFRLRQCREFLIYRIDAAEHGSTDNRPQ